MKKNVVAVIVGIFLISTAICGCQSGQVKKDYVDVFKSDVVNLINYTAEPTKNKEGIVVEMTVQGKIENILNRPIDITINASFYDKDNGYIGIGSYKIFGLRAKPSPGYSTTFTIIYSGVNVDKIEHIKLYAEELL